MEKVSIIIPIHNIFRRGLHRVRNSVISLQPQMEHIEDIIIVNSSDKVEFDMLDALLDGFKVKHIHYPLYCFNKPKLLNKGIQEANSKYIMCTDGDYLFREDFLNVCSELRDEEVMMHKQVKMLPNMSIKRPKIEDWRFPKCGFNKWGRLANGAVQYATKDFFMSNPYPEEMEGFSAMDNLMTYMAYKNGLDIHWIEQSEILHQYHPIVNKMGGSNRAKFDNNQATLQAYIAKHNLPCLLSK